MRRAVIKTILATALAVPASAVPASAVPASAVPASAAASGTPVQVVRHLAVRERRVRLGDGAGHDHLRP